MDNVDRHGALDEEPFSYRALKDGKVFIYWREKHVTTLAGKDAQLVMAKATGNFKRGNER